RRHRLLSFRIAKIRPERQQDGGDAVPPVHPVVEDRVTATVRVWAGDLPDLDRHREAIKRPSISLVDLQTDASERAASAIQRAASFSIVEARRPGQLRFVA